jgi:cysteine-rich repeat protein
VVVLSLLAVPAFGAETMHELRITSITALSVAQQITQPAVCTNTNACLHNEVRIPVRIDFEAGTIVIDGRQPVDENGAPVPPGGPGGMLFNTQSGPAELSFAPPCENPDGCVGGEALYFGTIDQGGHIAFPSLGLDFELFGVSPVSKFRAPMGTGATTDPADPGVVAEGSVLDFATGSVTLAGIDFIPAPIIGTSLQLDRIRGTIVPIPVPPVSLTEALRCQKIIQKKGAVYVKAAQPAVARCVDALVACEVSAETGSGGGSSCVTAAVGVCNASLATLSTVGFDVERQIRRGCQRMGAANLLATQSGLGFSLDKPLCDQLGVATSTRDGIATCMLRRMQCSVEEMVARAEPRAAEVLSANGFGQFVAPGGCMPAFTPGDATGLDSAALLRCQGAISKQASKYGTLKQKKLQGCIDRVVECHLHAEEGEMHGGGHVHDPLCVARAQRACDAAVRAIAAAGQKRVLTIQGACTALDAPGIPALAAGLGFSNLAEHCQELSPPVALDSVDDLIACLDARLDCAVEGAARSLTPRAAESLRIVGIEVNGIHLVDRYPCVEARCGDGIVDVGEECDPVFDPDDRCNADCTRVACGNGRLEPGEACDDGNVAGGDGCSSVCTIEAFSCGNGVVEPFGGEVCDDADTAAGDGCNATCSSNETCGNGVVDTIRGETCDQGGFDFVATLDGAQQVPPVVTAATGSATFTLNPDNSLTYSVTTSGLTGTVAHLHRGALGAPGVDVIDLDGGPTAWSGTTEPLAVDKVALLRAGNLFINVHTAANPNGEIRGQLGFAPSVSGDGCSADCRSDETCGNGVIDTVTGEACDDGNVAAGDGCDAACQLEACTFASSGAPLGARSFSVAPATSKLFNSILGLGAPVGSINITSGPFSLTATPTDAGGSAAVTLDADVIVQIDITLGGTVQCLKFEAAGTSGNLHCCGGHAVGMSFTRDSNTGGVPTTGGQSNGPAVVLGGIGTGGPGDLLMAFRVRESGGATGFDCLTATYGPPRTEFWTTGRAAARVVRPAQGGTLFEFASTGQPFDCANWTVEDGPGTFVGADTALNAVPGTDAGNVRRLDD